jgi:hypothetical protein
MAATRTFDLPPLTQQHSMRARVLFAFEAINGDCLSLQVGEEIFIHDFSNPEWWLGASSRFDLTPAGENAVFWEFFLLLLLFLLSLFRGRPKLKVYLLF